MLKLVGSNAHTPMSPSPNAKAPSLGATADRISQLDVLRGVALLGILVMNMISFGLPGVHYLNPTAEGPLEGLDYIAFLLSEVFASEKFMGLFSVLFGAGVVLFTDRIRSKGKSEVAWHYRRNFWLLLFGLAHAYLLWSGDILVTYAVCSLWLFLFRGWSVRGLLIAAGTFLGLLMATNVFLGLSMPYWEPGDVDGLRAFWTPDAASIAREVGAFRGSWWEQMSERIPNSFAFQTDLMPFTAARATGMMLLGMALYKAGVLTGRRDRRWNGRLALIGLALGTLISGFGVWQNERAGWTIGYSFFQGGQFRTLGMVPLVLGYIGAILWLCEGRLGAWIECRLAPVGRMALTNYLTQTLLATAVMYGHGLGWFATMGRAELWLVILPIWGLQIAWSSWWMARFRFGPFEWLWRTATYWKAQPMRR